MTVSAATGVGVRAQEITKTYRSAGGAGHTALDSVSLEIEPSSVVAITGPSGSGKSTFLHLVGGIDQPDAGVLEVGGQDITALSRRDLAGYRQHIGFVFQRFHLLPALTALDNVIAPVVPRRVDFDKAERARSLLADVGLASKADRPPSRLSGGEQQRVAIARSLIGRPRLLLADEPTGNLDTVNGEQIVDLLLGLRERHRVTVLIATHDARVAARCDRHITFRDGTLVADDEHSDEVES